MDLRAKVSHGIEQTRASQGVRHKTDIHHANRSATYFRRRC